MMNISRLPVAVDISRTDHEINSGWFGQIVDQPHNFKRYFPGQISRRKFPGQISRTNPIDRIKREGSDISDMGDSRLKDSRTNPSMISVSQLPVAVDISRTNHEINSG